MNRIFILLLAFFLPLIVCAKEYESVESIEKRLGEERSLQAKISDIGLKILNANKIDRRIIFTYSTAKKPRLKDESVTKRQVVFYDKDYKYLANDDEIAAFLSREISKAVRSYDGAWGGFVDAAQIKMAPKKYELFADERAVDYMVNAGYNPLALITYINKAFPQKRFDKFSYTNLTSKRLALIYEDIFTKYPQYLVNNVYLEDEAYQNFLLNSTENRIKLEKKVRSGSKESVRYE